MKSLKIFTEKKYKKNLFHLQSNNISNNILEYFCKIINNIVIKINMYM